MKDQATLEGVQQAHEILGRILNGDFSPERISRRRQQFVRALDNSVRHVKRSLLDFIDLQLKTGPTPEVAAMLELLQKRVHNDVSVIKSKVDAAFAIYVNGGEIPPFGRTDEELVGNGHGYRGGR